MAGFTQVGRYRLLRRIATGGMAEVWLATSSGAGGFIKEMVVKKILPHLATDPAFVAMFLNEAKLAARLNHPNIVQIFELGDDHGFFMVMEYVRGLPLRGLLREHQRLGTHPSFPLTARVIADASAGLHHAHELTEPGGEVLGLIHRDVSPDNLLVSAEGQVKVADFGIARASTTASHTQDGQLRGKIPYMAPERLAGKPIDRRSDVYALGVVMYEMLTGLRPFGSFSGSELMAQALFNQPPEAITRRPEIPQRLNEIVTRALANDEEERYPTALALGSELEDFLKREGCSQTEVGAWVRAFLPPEAPRVSPEPPMLTDSAVEVISSGKTVIDDAPVRQVTSPVAAAPRSTRWLLGAVIALATILGAAVTFSRSHDQPAPVAAKPSLPQDAATTLPAAPVAPTPAPPAAEPAAAELAVDAGAQALPELAVPTKQPRVEPRNGKLVVRVHPWADVFVDGQPMGVTPLAPLALTVGKHRVKLVNAELKKSVTRLFTIRGGAVTAVEVNLMAEE